MVKTSKLYNRFTFLSQELTNDENQKLVLETDKPFDEDSMFSLHVGPEKTFDDAEVIMFTQEEARQLWAFLSHYFGDFSRYMLLKDNDGHSFLVPVDKEQAFKRWLKTVYSDILEDEPMPEGVQMISVSPNKLTFSDPRTH